jgi:hypothetical protein
LKVGLKNSEKHHLSCHLGRRKQKEEYSSPFLGHDYLLNDFVLFFATRKGRHRFGVKMSEAENKVPALPLTPQVTLPEFLSFSGLSFTVSLFIEWDVLRPKGVW